MAPLVPYIISDEFNLIVALLVGIGFGFVLEQAGFSSTKKLVGLFYGYDFTVLRVFFTAGITALAGVLLLGHYGLLDLSLIYVNPTFTRSAIVGGAIMGAGFIIGGFCPGTSVCAAAIGKIDAFAFIFGSILGVFIFGQSYPLIKDFYLADALGNVRLNEFFGISANLFAFILISVALLAFFFTWLIENKVNQRKSILPAKLKMQYGIGMAALFVVLAVVSFLPSKTDIIEHRIAEAKRQQTCVFKEIDSDKLADQIVNHYYEINVIDVRTPEEYEAYHIPMAINIPFDEIMEKEWSGIFKQKLKTNIFYANSDTLVRMACLKAKFIGKSDNIILRETVDEFKAMFTNIEPPAPDALKKDFNIYVFRSKAAADMESLAKALENIGKPVKMDIKPVSGGCS
jgi:rhodanese-related sulfurtransferase